jgi:hypothetical protein
MQAKLVVISGRANRKEIPLKLPMTIGRSKDQRLAILHPTVSRHHCELFERDNILWVRDVGSANGTFVGDSRVTEAPLRSGDRLTVGPLVFQAVYEAPNGAEEPSAGPGRMATVVQSEPETGSSPALDFDETMAEPLAALGAAGVEDQPRENLEGQTGGAARSWEAELDELAALGDDELNFPDDDLARPTSPNATAETPESDADLDVAGEAAAESMSSPEVAFSDAELGFDVDDGDLNLAFPADADDVLHQPETPPIGGAIDEIEPAAWPDEDLALPGEGDHEDGNALRMGDSGVGTAASTPQVGAGAADLADLDLEFEATPALEANQTADKDRGGVAARSTETPEAEDTDFLSLVMDDLPGESGGSEEPSSSRDADGPDASLGLAEMQPSQSETMHASSGNSIRDEVAAEEAEAFELLDVEQAAPLADLDDQIAPRDLSSEEGVLTGEQLSPLDELEPLSSLEEESPIGQAASLDALAEESRKSPPGDLAGEEDDEALLLAADFDLDDIEEPGADSTHHSDASFHSQPAEEVLERLEGGGEQIDSKAVRDESSSGQEDEVSFASIAEVETGKPLVALDEDPDVAALEALRLSDDNLLSGETEGECSPPLRIAQFDDETGREEAFLPGGAEETAAIDSFDLDDQPMTLADAEIELEAAIGDAANIELTGDELDLMLEEEAEPLVLENETSELAPLEFEEDAAPSITESDAPQAELTLESDLLAEEKPSPPSERAPRTKRSGWWPFGRKSSKKNVEKGAPSSRGKPASETTVEPGPQPIASEAFESELEELATDDEQVESVDSMEMDFSLDEPSKPDNGAAPRKELTDDELDEFLKDF